MSAFRAIVRKELLELYLSRGQPRVSLGLNAVLALLVGIGLPLMAGLAFARGADGPSAWPAAIFAGSMALAVGAFTALVGAMPATSETFAGERERKTLPTLLTMPVRRGTLLGAKIVAQLAAVWAASGVLGVSFALTATIALGLPGLVVGLVLLPVLAVVSTAVALCMMGLGTLVSAKAETTKQAHQTLGYAMLPAFILPAFAGPFLSMDGLPTPLMAAVLVGLPLLVLGLGALAWMVAWRRSRRAYLLGL